MKLTVKQARVGVNLTQAEVAEHLGMFINTYRRKESGERSWYYQDAMKFAELVGLNHEDIIFFEDGVTQKGYRKENENEDL